MRRTSLTALALYGVLLAATLPANPAAAVDPCAAPHARSLVLSGGGAKGAFEAGAAYHLIVHRGCDFSEIAATSVGAINGGLLAQAAAANDAGVSLANLRAAAENLVDEWIAIEDGRDLMRTRALGKVRFALFGLDSVADLTRLRQFIREKVALEKLAAGRVLRVGVTTFVDGRYHEVVVSPGRGAAELNAHEIIFGSAVVPIFGRMVRTVPSASSAPLQLADGGLRHVTPVASYFSTCRDTGQASSVPLCVPLTGADTPPHPRTEQLFVIVTSPFARGSDLRPLFDARALDRDGVTITDGRHILARTFDLLVDSMYRDDLDDMLTYNELLEWHAAAAAAGALHGTFPLGSYNTLGAADNRSLPYEIVLVSPQREDADLMSLFSLVPATQRRQIFCGCIAADDAMQARFGLADMADRCAARFPGLEGRRAAQVRLAPAVCLAPAAQQD